jgi:hypothetical protein
MNEGASKINDWIVQMGRGIGRDFPAYDKLFKTFFDDIVPATGVDVSGGTNWALVAWRIACNYDSRLRPSGRRGRPPSDEWSEQVKMAKVFKYKHQQEVTNETACHAVGVSLRTLQRLRKNHPDFWEALERVPDLAELFLFEKHDK